MPDKKRFGTDDYVDVAHRIAEFRDKHPEGRLRPLNDVKPYEVVTVGNKTFVVVVAAAYRTPDDPNPGVGMAWEVFPGPTPFTRDSELQNAETSAWGRAIVATLAADTKRGIATKEDVENRTDPTGLPTRDIKTDGQPNIEEPPVYAPGPDDRPPNAAELHARTVAAGQDWLQFLGKVKAQARDQGIDVPDRVGQIDEKPVFRQLLQAKVEELEQAEATA